MKRFVSESLLLILLIIVSFLWEKSSFDEYTVTLLGVLVLTYFMHRFSRIKRFKTLPTFLLVFMSLILIITTGGLHSPLFFLIYFLSFILAFTLLPEMAFVFNIALFAAFLPEAMQGETVSNLTKLSSLLLLCPLAYFFGREIRARERREKQTKEAAEKIQTDVSEVVKTDGAILDDGNVEKLADIVKQTRQLEKGTKA